MEAEKQITDFVNCLKQAGGANLECVALFGSAATGDFHADYSDINILCVVNEVSAPVLEKLAPVINAWTKKKYPAPLIFSHTELKQSTDVFAIEMLDIRQRHRVLYGEDIFTGMNIPMDRHRVQLEHELRTKLLTLRQSYVQAVGDDKRIRRLMLDSVSNFSTLFRHTLSPWESNLRRTRRTTSGNWQRGPDLILAFSSSCFRCVSAKQMKMRFRLLPRSHNI